MKETYMASLTKLLGKSNLSFTKSFSSNTPFLKNSVHKFNKALIRSMAVFFIVSSFAISQKAVAQATDATQYTFSTSSSGSLVLDRNGNAVDMTTGTTYLVGPTRDDSASAVMNIGFNFYYFSGGGTPFTQFSASSNGAMRLGATAILGTTIGSNFPLATQAIIAPYLSDLKISTLGKVHYKTVGTAPNRTLVVEFLNMKINYSGVQTTYDGTFQVRLYEQSNIIEFVYGAMKIGNAAGVTTSKIAAIGISNDVGANNEFSVDQATYATTIAAMPITATNTVAGPLPGLNSTADGSRRVFTFTPTLTYKSQITSASTGSTNWCINETRSVTVTIKNIGTATWTTTSPTINIGAKFNANSGYDYTVTAANLLAGATTTYTIPVTAPAAPNAAENISFDVIKAGICAFGDNTAGCAGPGNTNFITPTQNVTISIAGPPITTQPSTATQSVCIGGSFTALSITATGATGYQWYSNTTASNSGGTILTGATTANYTPLGTAAGTLYYYCIAAGASACSATVSNVSGAQVVNPKPVSVGTTGPSTTCIGSTITLAGNDIGTSPFTYAWTSSTTATATINAATGALLGKATGTTNITYIVTDGNGCVGAVSAPFTITISKPTAGTITGTNKACVGNTTTLTPAATGVAPFTYTWASSNTGVATVNSSGVVTGITIGSANITYIATDANGCSSAASSNFVVTITAPIANAITGATKVCVGSNITLTSNATGTATLTYTWASSNTSVATVTTSGVLTGVAAGTANITYTVTDGNTCSATSAIRTITVNVPAIANAITGAAGICKGSSTTLTPNPTGVAPFTYVWSSSNTGIATVNSSGVVSGISEGNTNISYVVTDATGCPSSTSPAYAFAVANVPTAAAITQASGTNSLCVAGTLALTSNGTGTGTLTYVWSSSNTAIATVSNTGVVTGISAGSANITYITTNNNVCPSASSPVYGVTVIAIPLGTLAAAENSGVANNDNIICAGANVIFTATSGYGAYTFKVNGIIKQPASTSNTFSTNSLVNGDVVTVDVANVANCGSTFNAVTISVKAVPTATLSASKTTICPGDMVTFTAGVAGSNYAFNVNGSTMQSGTASTYNTSSLNNGDVVTVDVSNANSCITTSSPITINLNAVPNGTLTPSPTAICAGSNVTFTATAGFTSYIFKVDGTTVQSGTVSTYSSTAITNGQIITVAATNASGCTNTFAPVVMAVNALPTGTLSAAENSGTANDNSICAGATVSFTATSGFSNYNFKLNGASVQNTSANTYSNSSLLDNDIVTVDVTSGASCTASFNQVKITVIASPTGTLTASLANICAGDNITYTATTGFAKYTFKVNGTVTQIGTANTYSTTTINNGDVITVDVANTNTCSTTFNSITQTVNALPTGTLVAVENSGNTANDGIICTGAIVTFTAPGGFTNYNFLLNNVSVQNSAIATYATSGLINGDKMQVVITNSNNCIAFLNTINITVNTLPTIAAITGTTSVCVNSTTNLADATSGGTWSSLNTGIATVNSAGVVTGVASGTAVINYTVTNSNGCTAVASTSVTVNPVPVVAAIAGASGVCISSTTQLTDATTSGTWSSSNTSFATVSTTGLVTGVGAGTVTITYSVTNASGCITKVTTSITVNPLPSVAAITVTAPATFNVCVNSTLALADATTGGVWASSNTTIATISTTGIVTGVADGSTTISYTITNGSGCAAVASQIVAAHAIPVVTLSGPNPLCPGATATYTTQAGQLNYIWNITGATIVSGGTSTSNTVTVLWGAGTKAISINYSNSFGCTAATPATLTGNTGTIPTISGPASSCLNSSVTYTTQALKTNYTWTVTGGTITAGGTTNVATIKWTTLGTGSVSVNWTEVTGCSAASPTTIPVTVNALPTATISGTVAVCQNAASPNITFTGVSGAAPFTFSYNINGGATQTVSTTAGNTVTIAAPTTASGSYAYNLLSVADANTCSQSQAGTATVTITPAPTATIGGATSVCQSAASPNVTFTGLIGTAPFTFTYNINGGASLTVSTVSSNTVTVAAPTTATGSFTYNLVSVADANCSQLQTGSVIVKVNPTPTATISGTAQVCINGTSPVITFTGANGTAPYVFTYTINGGASQQVTSAGSTAVAAISAPTTSAGTFTYTLTNVKDGSISACTQAQAGSAVITINPLSVGGTVSASATVCAGSNGASLTLAGNTGNVVRWESSIDGGASWSTITNTTNLLTYSNLIQTTQYRAIIQSGACSIATSTVVIITVNAVSVGGTVNASATACSGTNGATLSLTGNTGNVVRWEYSINGGSSWATIANTTSSLTYANLTQTTLYRAVVQSGVCAIANSTPVTITISALPVATISGSTAVCLNAASPTITFTGTNGIAPYTFTYNINGGANLTIATTAGNTVMLAVPTGTAGIFNYNLVSIKEGSASACTQSQSGTVTVTVSALPVAPVISPASPAVCVGGIIALSSASSSASTTIASGNVNISIPDNSTVGAASSLVIPALPAGAVVTSVSVNFNITHNNDNDLTINLKAPNNSVLNLVNQKGGTGKNFTNTTISSASATAITGAAPFSSTYMADGAAGIVGATAGGGNTATVTTFASLYASTPNGNWVLSTRDLTSLNTGTINNWSITINYTIPSFTWSPSTNLYSDAAATVAYTGQSLTTVYVKPTAAVSVVYTATATSATGCTNASNVTLTVNPLPVASITADYCLVPNKVHLTAYPATGVTYLWNTGATTQTIDVDISSNYYVVVKTPAGCTSSANISVAQELVVNGDFTAGNTGFTSDYTYHAASTNALVDDTGTNGYGVGLDGQNYHPGFYGQDHTNNTPGPRNFMLVNGHGTLVIWKETVNVLPNTTYYYSAWGMTLNNGSPVARLQFNVAGAQVGSIDTLSLGVNNWTRFYGNWTSGPTASTVNISITDLETSAGANDFGIDDISFGTLSTFVTLESAGGSNNQTVCTNTPIVTITYNVGNGTSAGPTVTGLPAGVTSAFSGDQVNITGSPTVAGSYPYSITTTGCNPITVTGNITAVAPSILLTSGSSTPIVCANSTVTIAYKIGGTATGATTTGLPAGVTATLSGTTYTISGTPTVAGSYPFTITTTGGTCTQVTTSGTITVQTQSLTLSSAAGTDAQTLCINTSITNIQYTASGPVTGVTATGLPAGLSTNYSGGIFVISGTPTVSGTFNYKVVSTGTCTPDTEIGSITVNPAASIVLSSAAGTNAQNSCNNTAITPITYTITNGTGAAITAGALPTGVTGSFSGGVFTITGTPTVVGTFNYTVTTNGGCASSLASGTITTTIQTITLSSGSVSPLVCINTAITSIVYTIGGTATGATVSGLPAGITGSLSGKVFTISGTPIVAGVYNYIVTTTGTCATATAAGTITVQAQPVGGTLASVNVCLGSSGTLTLTGQTGSITRWESSTDNGSTWTNIVNNTISQSYTNVATTTKYRVLISNGCGSVYSTIGTVAVQDLWAGTVSTSWYTAANWNDGVVPTTACPTVTIPAGTPFACVLGAGTPPPIINLDIKSGATLTIIGTLQMAGSLTNAGTLNATAGTIEFNGTSAQNIAGSTFLNNTMMNLTVTNTAGLVVSNTAGSLLKITGALSFGNVNNSNLSTGDNVVLISTATGTARVADITNNGANSGNTFSGKVAVERYYPARRAWRLLTAPLSGAGLVFDTWQNGGVYTAGRGTYISGPGANPAANGMDVSPLSNTSLKVGSSLAPVTNTRTTNLSSSTGSTDNKGYFMFVRGDRVFNNFIIPNTTITTLSSIGKLQTNAQAFSVTPTANAYSLIGNPYASPVDFSKLTRSNLLNRFYAWDPYLNTEQGGYVLVDDPTNSGTYTVVPTSPGNQTKVIQSSQAVFVQTQLTGAALLTFVEPAKSTANNLSIFRVAGAPLPAFRTDLYLVNADSTTILADGNIAQFDNQFHSGIDQQDALKFNNVLETFGLQNGNTFLVADRRPPVTVNDTLFYKFMKVKQRKYQFKFQASDMDDMLMPILEDSYTNKRTTLKINNSTIVNFEIDANTASQAANRFRIVFKSKPLPLQYTSLTAAQQIKNVVVGWKVAHELTVKNYEIERSKDSISFTKILAKVPTADTTGIASYIGIDESAVSGSYFYRIKNNNLDSSFGYSKVIKVTLDKSFENIGVYPNPVVQGTIGLQMTYQPQGQYYVRLINALGQVVLTTQITHPGGMAMHNITINTKLPTGVYTLEVTKPNKVKTTIQVVIR